MNHFTNPGVPFRDQLEPPRLAEGGNECERQILQSARLDEVPTGARARVAAALGAVLAPRVDGAPGVDKPGGGAEVAHLELGSDSPGTLGKHGAAALMGLGLVGAVLGGFWLLRPSHGEAGSESIAGSTPALSLSPRVEIVQVESSSQRSPLPRIEPHPGARMSPDSALRVDGPRRAGGPRRASRETASAGGLLAEVRALDRVRSSLASRRTRHASRELELYRREFPRGELSLEADVLGVDVALAADDRERAVALARALLVRPAASRYHARLRTLVGDARGSNPESAHMKGRR